MITYDIGFDKYTKYAYTEKPEHWEKYGGIKVTEIDDDCLIVGDCIVHRGNVVYITGEEDWRNLITVVGTIYGWCLYDGEDESHAGLWIKSLYDDNTYCMPFYAMKRIEHFEDIKRRIRI